jgi:kynurenine formamidase
VTDRDDELRTIAARISNWGRWGADDEVGTPNTITPESVVRAAGLVREGIVVSLALVLDERGPQTGAWGRVNPVRTMLVAGDTLDDPPPQFAYADDEVAMQLQASTHWDGLGHVFHGGRMYGGRPASLVTADGATANGIEHLRDRVVARGVLVDVPRRRGVESLEPGEAIGPEEIEETTRATGVDVGPGDALLVRTGAMKAHLESGSWDGYQATPEKAGVSYRVAEWLRERDVAALATDTYSAEVMPTELSGARSPFHLLAVAHMGLLLGEMFQLEELGRRCAELGRWEFLFVAVPIPFARAVGSPVNPVAIL